MSAVRIPDPEERKAGSLFQENYRFIALAAVLNTASFLMLHLFSKEAADPTHESTQHTGATH